MMLASTQHKYDVVDEGCYDWCFDGLEDDLKEAGLVAGGLLLVTLGAILFGVGRVAAEPDPLPLATPPSAARVIGQVTAPGLAPATIAIPLVR